MHYIALGDSISIDDYTNTPGGGAASQLARLVSADQFSNLTRDGITTAGVIEALHEIHGTPDLVTITAGGNDFLQGSMITGDANNRDAWDDMIRVPVNNLYRIITHLQQYRCPIILSTIYDPTDGDDDLSWEVGVEVEFRAAYTAINEGIRALAHEHGIILADLQKLFRGHGIRSAEPWYVAHIEPNLAGATAIAKHWNELYLSATAAG